MKKVLGFLIDFQKNHFEWKLYLAVATFLAVSIVINYQLDFEDSYVDAVQGEWLHWPAMFLWQGLPFLAVCFILLAFGVKRDWINSSGFWITFVLGFIIQGLGRSFFLHELLVDKYLSGIDHKFIERCARWATSLFTVVIPLVLISKLLEDKESNDHYGLSNIKFDKRPYFIMLLIALVFIGIGSFIGEVYAYYPRYIHSGGISFGRVHELPGWLPVVLFESCYGSDFLGVEMFFRGFLVLAFARYLGGYAVVAMIATYCFLHFGKPMAEAVSSIFGGYILGIVTYYTRSIWGGVIIHVGIAWGMELFGYLQRLI